MFAVAETGTVANMARALLRTLFGVLVLVTVATVIAVGVVVTRDEAPLTPQAVEVTPRSGEVTLAGDWDPDVEGALVADAINNTVSVYDEPNRDQPHSVRPIMFNPTHEGLPVVFLVEEEVDEAWLKVSISSRPNGLTGYVPRSEVSLRRVPTRILVEVGAAKVTVFNGDEVLLEAPAAMGSDRTPTPLGHFFVDGVVELAYDSGPYGSHQVSVSGFSDVLHTFGTGNGQIALHGTNRPDLIGEPVSNGCVRLENEVIAQIAWLAPLGTPVEIVA